MRITVSPEKGWLCFVLKDFSGGDEVFSICIGPFICSTLLAGRSIELKYFC